MNQKIDLYLEEGCGRCPLGGTPDCKVHDWQTELKLLRTILLDCGLTEEIKWSQPCYTYNDGNVLILSAFKNYCALNFFKGALLSDPHQILVRQTENVQAGRQLRYTDVRQIEKQRSIIMDYVKEAIIVEKSGLKVETKNELVLLEELEEMLNGNSSLKAAFEALTPGRQRGYNLYFSAPKQSKTRRSRIEKYIPHILNGKGFHDR